MLDLNRVHLKTTEFDFSAGEKGLLQYQRKSGEADTGQSVSKEV